MIVVALKTKCWWSAPEAQASGRVDYRHWGEGDVREGSALVGIAPVPHFPTNLRAHSLALSAHPVAEFPRAFPGLFPRLKGSLPGIRPPLPAAIPVAPFPVVPAPRGEQCHNQQAKDQQFHRVIDEEKLDLFRKILGLENGRFLTGPSLGKPLHIQILGVDDVSFAMHDQVGNNAAGGGECMTPWPLKPLAK